MFVCCILEIANYLTLVCPLVLSSRRLVPMYDQTWIGLDTGDCFLDDCVDAQVQRYIIWPYPIYLCISLIYLIQ